MQSWMQNLMTSKPRTVHYDTNIPDQTNVRSIIDRASMAHVQMYREQRKQKPTNRERFLRNACQ